MKTSGKTIDILFFLILLIFIGIRLFKVQNVISIQTWGAIFTVFFIIIFFILEKIDFIQQFNLPVEASTKISTSTVLLSLAILTYSIKVLMNGKVEFEIHPFLKYFLYASLFLIVLILFFYEVLKIQYHISIDTYIPFLNKIVKYIMILVLVANYVTNEAKVIKLSTGLIISLYLILTLSFL